MKHALTIILLGLVLLTSCGAASPASSTTGAQAGAPAPAGAGYRDSDSANDAAAPAAEAPAAGLDMSSGADTQNVVAQYAQAQQERLVIRTASLQMLVSSVEQAEAQVRAIAQARNGFVLSAESYGEDDRRRATITFKVPAERFDDAINELGALAERVDSREIHGQDVTDEFVDLESRKRNLKAVEDRLLQFLSEAKRVEDLLQINQQLADVQGQIEQIEGRITYLKQSAALSTISVTLYAKEVVVVVPDPGWSPETTARLAAKQLVAFAQSIADVGIVFAIWAPVWLPLLLAGIWLRRRTRRMPPTTPAATPPAPPAPTQP